MCVCAGYYPVVVSSIRVFVTGDDLRSHPVRRSNEGVSAADGSIQLSADAKVHCRRDPESQHQLTHTNNTHHAYMDSRKLHSGFMEKVSGERVDDLLCTGDARLRSHHVQQLH